MTAAAAKNQLIPDNQWGADGVAFVEGPVYQCDIKSYGIKGRTKIVNENSIPDLSGNGFIIPSRG